MQVQLCTALQKLCLSTSLRMKPQLLGNLTSAATSQVRGLNFFQKVPANELWKSVSVVSNAGKKRGRGKRVNAKIVKDLYKGKTRGDNAERMVWPGLNRPAMKGKLVMRQEKLPEGLVEKAEETVEAPPRLSRKIHPLDRGYTSATICGCSLVGQQFSLLEGFDYRPVVMRQVGHMTGVYGRVTRYSAVVVCGNGNGVLGFGSGRSPGRLGSVQSAASKASRRLTYIDRYNDHTIMHDFFSQYYATKLFVSKQPEGFGLVCHPIIRTICQLVGIKDIYAKVEGSTNKVNVVKAFILGLIRQRQYEDMANEKRLHLVEFDSSKRGYPNVLASPEVCRSKDEIPSSESLDFKQFALGGKVVLERPKTLPFYCYKPSWQTHLHRAEFKRGEREQLWQIRAQHGTVRSFLTDKFPECKDPTSSN